jgi:hypothetical protein
MRFCASSIQFSNSGLAFLPSPIGRGSRAVASGVRLVLFLSSSRRRGPSIPCLSVSLDRGYWMPAFAGMTAECRRDSSPVLFVKAPGTPLFQLHSFIAP